MKYIIMAGGNYKEFETPKQLLKVKGERLIDRTIRLLKENNVDDIAMSSNNPFEKLNVKRGTVHTYFSVDVIFKPSDENYEKQLVLFLKKQGFYVK